MPGETTGHADHCSLSEPVARQSMAFDPIVQMRCVMPDNTPGVRDADIPPCPPGGETNSSFLDAVAHVRAQDEADAAKPYVEQFAKTLADPREFGKIDGLAPGRDYSGTFEERVVTEVVLTLGDGTELPLEISAPKGYTVTAKVSDAKNGIVTFQAVAYEPNHYHVPMGVPSGMVDKVTRTEMTIDETYEMFCRHSYGEPQPCLPYDHPAYDWLRQVHGMGSSAGLTIRIVDLTPHSGVAHSRLCPTCMHLGGLPGEKDLTPMFSIPGVDYGPPKT